MDWAGCARAARPAGNQRACALICRLATRAVFDLVVPLSQPAAFSFGRRRLSIGLGCLLPSIPIAWYVLRRG